MPKSVLAAFVTSLLAWPLGHFRRPLFWLNSRNKDPLLEWGDVRCRAAAQAEAYRQLAWIQEQLAAEFTEPALRRMFEREKWFLRNREFLPGELARSWLSIRDDLQSLRECSKPWPSRSAISKTTTSLVRDDPDDFLRTPENPPLATACCKNSPESDRTEQPEETEVAVRFRRLPQRRSSRAPSQWR